MFKAVLKPMQLDVAIKMTNMAFNPAEVYLYEKLASSKLSTVKLVDHFKVGDQAHLVTRFQSDGDL